MRNLAKGRVLLDVIAHERAADSCRAHHLNISIDKILILAHVEDLTKLRTPTLERVKALKSMVVFH